MAEYFVSVQTGNDVNDGLSPEQAWATITKAVGVVAAGDIVRIAPGVYRELPSLLTEGTSSLWIQWLPDPDCVHFPGVKPGIIRITGRGTDEQENDAIVWHFNTKRYNRLGERDKWGQVYIDGPGSTTYAVVIGNYGGSNLFEINGAQITGGGGVNATSNATDLRMANSIVMGGTYGVYGGYNCFNVISVGPTPFRPGWGALINCVAIGGAQYGSFYGISPQAAIAENCFAIGSAYGFRGMATQNCVSIGNTNASTSTTGQAVKAMATLSITEQTFLLLNLLPLIEAFRPLFSLHADSGNNTYGNATYDIAGHVRKLGSGTIGFGPYETSTVSVDYQNYRTNAPAIKIERAGMQRFVFHAKGGEEFTKAVWVKWTGTTKPQLVIDGDHVDRTAQAALGGGSDWEQLTISATPGADGEIELYLYARDTGASSAAYFSDLE